MSRLSTKQRRAQRFRRSVVKGMAVDHRGRWLLPAGEHWSGSSRLSAQGWKRDANRFAWRRP